MEVASDVVQAAFVGLFGRDGQHLGRNIRGPHVVHVRRKGKRRVSGRCGDVQNSPMGFWVDQLHQAS